MRRSSVAEGECLQRLELEFEEGLFGFGDDDGGGGMAEAEERRRRCMLVDLLERSVGGLRGASKVVKVKPLPLLGAVGKGNEGAHVSGLFEPEGAHV